MSGQINFQLPNGFRAWQLADAFSGKKLHLTILPTEKCNFRCTYCYEDFVNGRMAAETIEGIKSLMTTRVNGGITDLQIAWFGGEPLLAWPVMKEILQHTVELQRSSQFRVYGGVTTNAYLLTPEVAQELISYGMDFFQITLDGWEKGHDVVRRRADGTGTFDVIWRNLKALKLLNVHFECQLRVHLRHDNHDSLKTLITAIRAEFQADKRFRVDFQDVRDLGGDAGGSVVAIRGGQMDTMIRDLTKLLAGETPTKDLPTEEFESLPKKTGESASRMSAKEAAELGDAPYVCYAAKANHFLIRSTGRVGKCTVFLDDARNDIGSLLPSGEIQLDAFLTKQWSKGFSDFNVETLGCPVHAIEKTAPRAQSIQIIRPQPKVPAPT